jgi:hypothetical protein
MKRFISLMVAVIAVAGAIAFNAAAQDVTISDPSGSPLQTGDIVQIVTSRDFDSTWSISDAYYHFYYDSGSMGTLHIPPANWHSVMLDPADNYRLKGNFDLLTTGYESANRLTLEMKLLHSTPVQLTFYSNSLDVLPTAPFTPSTTAWGMIALMIMVSALLIRIK